VLIVFSLHRESLKLILAMNPFPRWFCHTVGPAHWRLGRGAMATAPVVGPSGGMMALLSAMEANDVAPSGFSTPKKSNPFPIGKLF
jgi:hypothetical protein